MKIIRFKENFYTHTFQNINSLNKTYNELFNEYENNKFPYSDNLGKILNTYDNINCVEFVTNSKELQLKWATEHNLLISDNRNFLLYIFFKQIELLRPDILYFQGKIPFNISGKIIKDKFKFVKFIVVHNGFPNNKKIFEGVDTVLTVNETLKKYYAGIVKNLYILPHYFDKEKLKFISNNKKNNIMFYGMIDNHHTSNNYNFREKLLKTLLKKIDIKCYLYRKNTSFSNEIKSIMKLKRTFLYNPFLKKKICKPIFGEKLFKTISENRICLNVHTSVVNEPLNMRIFETTGMNSLLLTERTEIITNYFKENEEIVIYDSIDDCLKKIKYLVNNPDKIKEISENGHKKTLQNYTIDILSEKIIKLINKDI